MTNAKQQFAARLKKAMETAGYDAKPAVLEREFNQRYMGSPLTLHGVRRWLMGGGHLYEYLCHGIEGTPLRIPPHIPLRLICVCQSPIQLAMIIVLLL